MKNKYYRKTVKEAVTEAHSTAFEPPPQLSEITVEEVFRRRPCEQCVVLIGSTTSQSQSLLSLATQEFRSCLPG